MSVADEFATDDLQNLVLLQETEAHIRKLRHQLDGLPEQAMIEEAQAEVRALDQDLGEQRLSLDMVGAEQRKLEGEIDLLTRRRDAEQARMYDGSITNPRELQGVRAELESVQRRISDHEDTLLELLERVEELEGVAGKLSADRDRTAARIAELEAQRDDVAKELIAELAELEVRRDQQRRTLPPALLQRYDAILERTHTTAVGELRSGMCTACRIPFDAITLQELERGPALTTCPECRRLLVTS